MKFTFLFFILSSFFFLSGCHLLSTPPAIEIRKDIQEDNIAVLNFSREGSLGVNASKNAADKLTDALFATGKFNVIDRSKVNEAEIELGIKSTEFLSDDEIQKLGAKLKAGYLVLGRISQSSEPEIINMDEEKELYVSFRIISAVSSDVVGVVSYSYSYTDDLTKAIDISMRKIAEKIIEK